jgi:predicted ATP-dependent serine protease
MEDTKTVYECDDCGKEYAEPTTRCNTCCTSNVKPITVPVKSE